MVATDDEQALREQYEFSALISRLSWAVGATFGVRYNKKSEAWYAARDVAHLIYKRMTGG